MGNCAGEIVGIVRSGEVRRLIPQAEQASIEVI